MNDIFHKTSADDFENIADDSLRGLAEARREQRSFRRAAAINAVQMARAHADRGDNDPYSQSEADVIMAIMELLDRVADQ